jgi:hypothetical protein
VPVAKKASEQSDTPIRLVFKRLRNTFLLKCQTRP